MTSSDHAILIPTGRHYYLNRLIDYYDYCGESAHVVVLDCSKTPWERTPPPGVTYHHMPGVSFMGRLAHAVKTTDAGYFSMCADDDFVVPSTIGKCARFLAQNPEYGSAYGRYVRFTVKDKIEYGDQYPREHHRDLDQDSPAERVLDIMGRYIQLFYAVHSRRVMERLAGIEELYVDEYFLNACGERVFTVAPPLFGKVKYINDVFALREQENHKCSRHLSYLAMARAWVVCNDVMLRLLAECGADTSATRVAMNYFVEKWIYTHFSGGIKTSGEPKPARPDEDMDGWLRQDEDNLAYITYRGKVRIPSDRTRIARMGFDDQEGSEEAIGVADQFLKRFVAGYLASRESKKST